MLMEKVRKEEEIKKQEALLAKLEAEKIERKRVRENFEMMSEDKPEY